MTTIPDISDSGFVDAGSISNGWSEITLLQSRPHSMLYRAKRFGRWFVLKGLPGEMQCLADYRIQQEREFLIGVQLVHPNIVATYSLENIADLGRCIVMEWVDGMTLLEWLSLHPSNQARQRALEQLLDALDYLHVRQLVHHDIKPSNILITNNGNNLKLIDFGLSNSDDNASPMSNDPQDDLLRIAELLTLFHLPSERIIISRCRHGHYRNIDALRRDIDRKIRLRRTLPISILFVCMVCAIVLLGCKIYQQSVNDRQAKQRQEAMITDVKRVCDDEETRLFAIADAEPYQEFAMTRFYLNCRFLVLRDSLNEVYSCEDALLHNLCCTTFDHCSNAIQIRFSEHLKQFPTLFDAYKNGEISAEEYGRLVRKLSAIQRGQEAK